MALFMRLCGEEFTDLMILKANVRDVADYQLNNEDRRRKGPIFLAGEPYLCPQKHNQTFL